jgi:hypothetical protein
MAVSFPIAPQIPRGFELLCLEVIIVRGKYPIAHKWLRIVLSRPEAAFAEPYGHH